MRSGAALSLLVLLSVAQSTASAEQITTYNHVRLIDGTGAPARNGMAIAVKGDRIVAITSSVKTAKGVVDMKGSVAIPGMINTHVHLATWPNLPYAEAIERRNLYGGITAVRDMAGDTRELAYLKRAIEINEAPGSDIYYAALMAGPEFFHDPRTVESTKGYDHVPGQVTWMRAITTQTNLPLAIAEAKGAGATAIKIYADLPAPLVRSIATEAHHQQLLVWAHAAVFPASPKQVADAGVDVMSHVCMLGYQASAAIPHTYHNRAPVDAVKLADPHALDALLADMKKRSTIMDATLYVYEVLDHMKNATPPPYCTLAMASKLLGEAYRAGVPISAGTDADSDWHDPLPALPDELALLVKAGMTPMDAIRSATAIAARTIGQQAAMGTLEPGKLANIVFLAKDPLANIANVKTVLLTIRRGKPYPRRDFKPITTAEAKYADD